MVPPNSTAAVSANVYRRGRLTTGGWSSRVAASSSGTGSTTAPVSADKTAATTASHASTAAASPQVLRSASDVLRRPRADAAAAGDDLTGDQRFSASVEDEVEK